VCATAGKFIAETLPTNMIAKNKAGIEVAVKRPRES
jgi:hypothetical protein